MEWTYLYTIIKDFLPHVNLHRFTCDLLNFGEQLDKVVVLQFSVTRVETHLRHEVTYLRIRLPMSCALLGIFAQNLN